MYNFYKILIFVLLLFSNASYADDSAKGKLVAEGICSICHGINGIAGSAGNSALVPNLIAQNKLYLIEKLNSYKNGKIEHHQMSLIAQMLSDDDIKNVAEWYSSIEIDIITEIEPLDY